MIDLTAAEFPAAEQEQHAAAPLHRSHRSAARPVVHKQPVAAVQTPIPSPSPAPASPVEAGNKAAAPGSAGEASAVSGTGKTGTKEAAGAEARGAGDASAPAETTATLQKRYLREHFTYIRDLIGRELRYPRQAIRMNWSGRVTVSFLVLGDGRVSEVTVARSSGCPLLDANALDTVRKAAPFPRPPVSARLLIPVDYILE